MNLEETYRNNNDLLISITKDLQEIIKSSNDISIIRKISEIIIKINSIINENNKSSELMIKSQMNEIKINTNNIKELKTENGRYYGQVVNGLREGKGIYYLEKEPFKGDRYDGEWKNDKRDGKGIEYFHNGDKYEGDWRNGKLEGKGLLLL